MSDIVLYMCAPVSADTPDGIRANLANARAWLQWLTENGPVTVCAPWIAAVEAALEAGRTEAEQRDRGLRDCLAIIERTDGVVLVGGRISSDMAMERAKAIECGLHVLDMSRMGISPPGRLDEKASDEDVSHFCCAEDLLSESARAIWRARSAEVTRR